MNHIICLPLQQKKRKMKKKYSKKEFLSLSNEELLKITKDRAIDFHLNNSRLAQLCVNDLQGFDCENSLFYTRTGIKILLQDVDYIEVS